MEPWVVITLAAAAIQTLRFSLQKRLAGLGLSTGGATFSRFLFAAPLAGAALAVVLVAQGLSVPRVGSGFWVFAMAGGVAQIIATFCTVALFAQRSFAVGVAFTKSETLLVALFSALLLAETVSASGLAAIIIGSIGVLALSRPVTGWRQGGVWNRATALGLAAGALFGLSAIGYRGATQAVLSDVALVRALVALTFVTAFQTLAMALWLRWREPGAVAQVARRWRETLPVAVTGVGGSLCWFVAFALQNAAYVRALGQVELIFALIVSMRFFRETPRPSEVIGLVLLSLSLVALVLVA